MIARAEAVHRPGHDRDQDAGGPHPPVARGCRQRPCDARCARARYRDHDRRQHGMERRHGDPGRAPHRRVRSRTGSKSQSCARIFAGYQRVAAALKTRIVGGESHFTRLRSPSRSLRHPSSPILQPDPDARRLERNCARSRPWPTPGASRSHLTSSTSSHVHLLASIPNASWLEYMDWNDDLWVRPVLGP